MKRHLNAQHVKAIRKLRKMAGISIGELAAVVRIDCKRLHGFELNRVRLRERETANLCRTLFEGLAAKFRIWDLSTDPELARVEELNRLLEQLPYLDVEALIPMDLPMF
jgi:transcriptional regulator with XRE-family HTH domain